MSNLLPSALLIILGILFVFIGTKVDVKGLVGKDTLHSQYSRPTFGKILKLYNIGIYLGIRYGLILGGVSLILVGTYLLFL